MKTAVVQDATRSEVHLPAVIQRIGVSVLFRKVDGLTLHSRSLSFLHHFVVGHEALGALALRPGCVLFRVPTERQLWKSLSNSTVHHVAARGGRDACCVSRANRRPIRASEPEERLQRCVAADMDTEKIRLSAVIPAQELRRWVLWTWLCRVRPGAMIDSPS